MGGRIPVIVGPTAVGKTGLVTALARKLPVEVISLDSRQVYHGLRIGTAQPTEEEKIICPHHLIDFLSPREKYSAIRFRADFEEVYAQIRQRGGVPILVGGAGMYLTALRDGFMNIPGSTPEALKMVREKLDALSDRHIRDQLEITDAASFATIHPNDRYRSQRALEIFHLSGSTLTQLKAQQEPEPCLGLAFPTFVLQRDVAELDGRIARRTELMLKEGWIQETEQVLQDHPHDCPGLKSIGYREIVSFLRRETSKSDLSAEIVLVTRQYAKRQRTWFRHIPQEAAYHPEDNQLENKILNVLSGE